MVVKVLILNGFWVSRDRIRSGHHLNPIRE